MRPSFVVLLATALLMVASASAVRAAPLVRVKITIEHLEALDDFEDGAPDFYACVTIAGRQVCNEDQAATDQFEVNPDWPFTVDVDTADPDVSMEIELRDEDGAFRLGDDHIDVDPTADGDDDVGRNLSLSVALDSCVVSGDATGTCDVPITVSGTQDERATLRFRIEVGALPFADDLQVRCTHTPIWPQPAGMLTLTARALDAALALKAADAIEIWVNEGDTPAQSVTMTASSTLAIGPFPDGATVSYGCRARIGITEVWSGWRVVQVGMPARGRAVPIVNVAPRTHAIDIVMFPDRDSYDGAADMDFQSHVEAIINDGFYADPHFLKRQDRVSFWISLDEGKVEGVVGGSTCDSENPESWDDHFAFADAGALLHTDPVRDCAPSEIFTADVHRTDRCAMVDRQHRVFLHETGHRPFGLADEYCCDGGYFTADPFPNVYEGLDECRADVPALAALDVTLGDVPRRDASCREIVGGSSESVSDPDMDDLMNDNCQPRAGDVRRIEWLFGRCAAGRC